MRRILVVAALVALAGCKHKQEVKPQPPPEPKIETVALPPSDHPTVAIRVLFRTGSIDDPAGKEGLTALCAHLMAEGGTASLSAAELQERLFPLAADLHVQVDKEQTVFVGRVHKDFADRLAAILGEVVAKPRLDPKEFERLRTDAVNGITQELRSSDDEQLSRQALLNFMFAGHPYSSYVGGSVAGLKAITLDDVKKHIAKVFTLDRLTLGVAGNYQPTLVDQVKKALVKLPAKGAPAVKLPAAPTQIRVRLVEKDTDSTAMFLGYPWEVKRGDPDYFPLAVGISALGEHRQTGGRLFEELRSKRGLNYGDYAYVEHFIQQGYGTYPLTNIALGQQYFGVWIRSVETANRLFALRAGLHVVKKTAEAGLSAEEVERAKGFLSTYTRLWEQTDDRKLGYALDDRFYGTKDFLQGYRDALGAMTAEQVNAALKKHIDVSRLHLAAVTRGADAFAKELEEGKPSPLKYPSKKPAEVMAEDKLIEKYELGLKAADIQVVKAEELFEK